MPREVLNNSWRRLPGYLQGQQKSIGKRSTCKKQKSKNTQVNECPIDALLTKNHDNEVSRAYVENMPEPRMYLYLK